jgi:nitroreductase
MAYNDLEYIKEFRLPEYKVGPAMLQRWSPRALSGEAVAKDELMSLFEAAKWAPSAFNGQPWRFLYAFKESKEWPLFFNLMAEMNQLWTKNAGALIVVLSQNNFEYNGKVNLTHSFDTGSAWQNIALEASDLGLVAHAMSGFDYEKARQDLKIPDDYTVEAMIAIGRPGNKEDLPKDFQEREQPSDRKKIVEIAIEGTFSF